jgi:hypothetical protein
MKPICAYILVAVASVMVCSASYAAKPLSKQGKRVAKALMSTDPNEWQLVESIDLKFDTYHPQGMLKVDDTFYITTVKVERRPRYTRQGKQVSVMDEGAGKGYLMQFDAGGNLLKCIELCEGAIFHPGGMDFDGRYIWVPITKYYPYSRSLIVRVDVRNHQVEKVCYVDDSIGAIIHDTDNNILVGANWDADEFLTWQLDSALEVKDAELTAAERRHANTAKHLAIQDSKYIGGGKMVGFGLKSGPKGRVGGFDVIDTRTFEKLRSADIELRTPRKSIVSGNPSTIEIVGDKMRLYFAPEDNKTTLYIYQTQIKK